MCHPAKSSLMIALFVTCGPAALDDLRWAATGFIVAALVVHERNEHT
jgi:hypothetical protein